MNYVEMMNTNARRENKMTTEQAQLEALKTLHEAIQALKDLGFITEGNEDE